MRYSSIRPSSVRLCAKSGPATSISPSRSAFSSRIAPSRSSPTSLALGPTDFNERETTHFGWFRHAAAKACSSASLALAAAYLSRTEDDLRPDLELGVAELPEEEAVDVGHLRAALRLGEPHAVSGVEIHPEEHGIA